MTKENTAPPLYRAIAAVAVAPVLVLAGVVLLGGRAGSHKALALAAVAVSCSAPSSPTARRGPASPPTVGRPGSRALFATALAQLLVPVIALAAGLHRGPIVAKLAAIVRAVILNGLFAPLFAVPALPFRRAAQRSCPGAPVWAGARGRAEVGGESSAP